VTVWQSKLPEIDPTDALDCWYLTGPTASGKTAIGIELARRIGAEIISLDSMAIYRGMDIGTAKPTLQQQSEVRHHLIDIAEPGQSFSAFEYVQRAHERIARIRNAGRNVVFVGGTPLYLKAMIRGLFKGPAADWNFRREIEQELRQVGQAALHERLSRVDPVSAARLHPNDTRRLIRALEVYRLTGQPISHWQMQFEEPRGAHRVFVVQRTAIDLDRRIESRVESMFSAGLVMEVLGLKSAGRKLGRTARQAVGYREVIDYLAGQCTLDETITRVKTRTRRFAKRQKTWFRSLDECRFVRVGADAAASDAVEAMLGQAEDPLPPSRRLP